MTMAWTEHVQIRPIGQEDKALMKTFLYAAIFVPEGEAAPPREIVNEPALALYVQDFGDFGAASMAWAGHRYTALNSALKTAAQPERQSRVPFGSGGQPGTASVPAPGL